MPIYYQLATRWHAAARRVSAGQRYCAIVSIYQHRRPANAHTAYGTADTYPAFPWSGKGVSVCGASGAMAASAPGCTGRRCQHGASIVA